MNRTRIFEAQGILTRYRMLIVTCRQSRGRSCRSVQEDKPARGKILAQSRQGKRGTGTSQLMENQSAQWIIIYCLIWFKLRVKSSKVVFWKGYLTMSFFLTPPHRTEGHLLSNDRTYDTILFKQELSQFMIE
ncbi:hypothetical protein Mapa_002198 [Marchantia paleacea]|nr:hypothetical protein Mapa_002198 [Marchantia paleacea]